METPSWARLMPALILIFSIPSLAQASDSIPFEPYPFDGNPDMGLFSYGGGVKGISYANYSIIERYLENPYVVGHVLASGGHLTWSLFEPEEGVYNWTLLDRFTDAFESSGRRYIFNIEDAVGPSSNFCSPDWIYAKSATKLCAGCVWIRLGTVNYSPDVQPLRWSGYKNENNVTFGEPVGNGAADVAQVDDAVNGGRTKAVSIGGREARSTDKQGGQNYIYFRIDGSYISNPDGFQKYLNKSRTILTLSYFDVGNDTIKIEYDGISSPYSLANKLYIDPTDFSKGTVTVSGIQRANSMKWKTASLYIPPSSLRFGKSQAGGHDLRIYSTGADDLIIDYLDISTHGWRGMEMDPSPNWHDEAYFQRFQMFLEEMGRRYGNKEGLDSIRTFGYGRWNEMSIATYGNKDWVNILSGAYGINPANMSDPLHEVEEATEDSEIPNFWRWPRHELLVKKFIDLFNSTFSKPVEFSVKVTFSMDKNYALSLVKLVDYAATKSNVMFNHGVSSSYNAVVQRYWESKMLSSERDLDFYGIPGDSWYKRFKPMSEWVEPMKERLAYHANYAYLYTADTDIVYYDPAKDTINPPEEKAVAREEGIKALRYLATHLGYQIEAGEPEFPSAVLPGEQINISTKWYQRGNGKPYQDFRIFFALKGSGVTDLGAYYPGLLTSRWNSNYSNEAGTVNLIQNPSFEDDFAGWTIESSKMGTPDISAAYYYDGIKSAHFKNDGSGGSTISAGYIPVEPDTDYELGAWAKGYNVAMGNSSWHKLYLVGRFYDGNKQILPCPACYADITNFATGTFDWRYFKQLHHTPGNASYFRVTGLGIISTGGGEAWVDKVKFQKVSRQRTWKDTDPPFYVEDARAVAIPSYVPPGNYTLVLGLVTEKGQRIKLINGRDANGTMTPDNLSDDIFGRDYYESAGSISVCHRSDANKNSCVENPELLGFIDLWSLDSQDVTIRELMEAIGLWKRGCY